MVEDPGKEFQDISASDGLTASGTGPAAVEHLAGVLAPAEPFEDDRAADHGAAEADGALPVLHSHRAMCREPAVAPGQEVVDDPLGDQLLPEEHPQHLGPKEPLDVLGVEGGEWPEGALRCEAAVRHQHADMRVEVEQLPRGLHEPHRARSHVGAVEVGCKVELQSPPGAAGQFSDKLTVVAEEDPQPLAVSPTSVILLQAYDGCQVTPYIACSLA